MTGLMSADSNGGLTALLDFTGDNYAIADMDVHTALFEISGDEHRSAINAHDPEWPAVSLGPVTSLRFREASHAVVVP